MQLQLPSPIQAFSFPGLQRPDLAFFVKRDDLIHPYVSGNKARKLKYLLQEAKTLGKTKLVTFGGAYSSHLLATAFAAQAEGLQALAFVRGEEVENDVLTQCKKRGMELLFTDRLSYRNKQQLFTDRFGKDPQAYFISEGGYSELAAKGVAELINELPESYDHLFCACGTGATLAGLALGIQQQQLAIKAEGISVLKHDALAEEIHSLCGESPFILHSQFHEGGYAKSNPELEEWIRTFIASTKIPIEFVYTGKLFKAVEELARQNYFLPNSRVLLLHTGGILPKA